jgi:hypothetical protein
MSDSKPYEIRADLLSLAKDVLMQNMHVRLEVNRQLNKVELPPLVTTEEIVAEAEKLYAFVSRR